MAKTRRVSGDLKIELSFNERTNNYQVKLCPVGRQPTKCERVQVGAPMFLWRGVDHPKAFTDAARAAISFASNDLQERAEWGDQGPVVRFPRHRGKR